MIFSDELISIAYKINKLLNTDRKTENFYISTAESCTGGLISAALTAIPGSSNYYDRGFITYSNQAKIEMLGVNEKTIENFGAVSEETAKEMAIGCLDKSKSQISLAVTGIAGPGGGNKQKPVGTVIFAVATNKNLDSYRFLFQGNRDEIRQQAAIKGLEIIYGSL